MSKARIYIGQGEEARRILGANDEHLRSIRSAYGVRTSYRRGYVHVIGDAEAVDLALEALERIRDIAAERGDIGEDALGAVLWGEPETAGGDDGIVLRLPRGRKAASRTSGQADYLRAIVTNDIVFAIGPAGTGKTYLAVAAGLHMLREGRVRRLILARPAVEAGERLGFLPGDFRQKVNPYLRPLYDALTDMLPMGELEQYLERGVVEVAPLAYMRGRTLSHAFVILDEAQNTTGAQMLMFLTRLGPDARSVVTGDITQIDLPEGVASGLVEATSLLAGVQSIATVRLTEADIVRHRLVKEIVAAYEHASGRRRKGS